MIDYYDMHNVFPYKQLYHYENMNSNINNDAVIAINVLINAATIYSIGSLG